jgi:hypothetical protein
MAYAGPVEIKIFDRIGRLIEQHTLQREIGKRMEFTLPSGMKAGLYLVQVAWADKVENLKFMKLP